MPKAALLFHEKVRTVEGIIVELKVWEVGRSSQYPEGFKYSFFAVKDGVVLVGYDNHAPKGHHRHLGEADEAYEFVGLDRLRADFASDLEQARKRAHEETENGIEDDSGEDQIHRRRPR